MVNYTSLIMEVMSAGDRDPDSDDVTGMSHQNKERQQQRETSKHCKGVPKSLSQKDAELFKKILFNEY